MAQERPDWDSLSDWASQRGMDRYLSSLESLLTAIRQRPMLADQLDRYALLLQQAEQDALFRVKKRRRRNAA